MKIDTQPGAGAKSGARHIAIDVHGAKVPLRGSVHAGRECNVAHGAVGSAPGLRVVINELKVE